MTRVPRPACAELAGLAVASAVLLTGCGAVPDLNPGVAVRVGDDTVSTRHVADLSTDYCGAAAARSCRVSRCPVTTSTARVAGSIALRSAADQLLAEHGVDGRTRRTPTPSTQVEAQLGSMTDGRARRADRGRGARRPTWQRSRPPSVATSLGALGRPTRTRWPPARRRSSPGSTTTTCGSTRATASRSSTGQTVLLDTRLSYRVSTTAKTADAAAAGRGVRRRRCRRPSAAAVTAGVRPSRSSSSSR